MQAARLIMYHKQSTSARTRFLKLAHGGVCAFDALPRLAQLSDAEPGDPARVLQHPAALLSRAEQSMGLPRGGLELDTAYRVRLDVPGDPIEVFLARFTDVDPPIVQAESAGACFIDLTQARGLPPTELQLLRLAYESILG